MVSAAHAAELPQSWVVANAALLPALAPSVLKAATPVSEIRNPLRVAQSGVSEPIKLPAGVKGSEASKLRANLAARVRSVSRGSNALVAIDTRFVRIGDEVVIGVGEEAVSPIAGARVVLTKIGTNDLIFTIQSTETDGTTPWQTDVSVPLPASMRKH